MALGGSRCRSSSSSEEIEILVGRHRYFQQEPEQQKQMLENVSPSLPTPCWILCWARVRDCYISGVCRRVRLMLTSVDNCETEGRQQLVSSIDEIAVLPT